MPAGRPPHALFSEFGIIDRMSPGLRTLVHEYGFNVVQAARDMLKDDDPERIEKFCKYDRDKKQAQLEAAAQAWDSKPMAAAMLQGLARRTILRGTG